MKINLGDEVQDRVTGFKGIAVARTQWLTGCDRITIQPKLDKEGKASEPMGFDEGQLKVLKKGAFKIAEVREKPEKRGGPRPEPKQKT